MTEQLPTKKMVCPKVTKPYTAWLVSNWGIPWSVERTRRAAIEYAQNITGKGWNEIKDHCRVQKVEVRPL